MALNDSIVPDQFNAIDALFGIVTLLLIIKFVNSLRPILGE